MAAIIERVSEGIEKAYLFNSLTLSTLSLSSMQLASFLRTLLRLRLKGAVIDPPRCVGQEIGALGSKEKAIAEVVCDRWGAVRRRGDKERERRRRRERVQ